MARNNRHSVLKSFLLYIQKCTKKGCMSRILHKQSYWSGYLKKNRSFPYFPFDFLKTMRSVYFLKLQMADCLVQIYFFSAKLDSSHMLQRTYATYVNESLLFAESYHACHNTVGNFLIAQNILIKGEQIKTNICWTEDADF